MFGVVGDAFHVGTGCVLVLRFAVVWGYFVSAFGVLPF